MFMYGSTAVLSDWASVRLCVDGILLKPQNHLSWCDTQMTDLVGIAFVIVWQNRKTGNLLSIKARYPFHQLYLTVSLYPAHRHDEPEQNFNLKIISHRHSHGPLVVPDNLNRAKHLYSARDVPNPPNLLRRKAHGHEPSPEERRHWILAVAEDLEEVVTTKPRWIIEVQYRDSGELASSEEDDELDNNERECSVNSILG